MATRAGPAWLGIGAQRSGTTWLVELMTQHPSVGLSEVAQDRGGAWWAPDTDTKEAHFLYRGIVDGWNEQLTRSYVDRFESSENLAVGEFTPDYLKQPWVVDVARSVLPPEAPIIAMLRDPVDRFESAMKPLAFLDPDVGSLDKVPNPSARLLFSDAIWGGMYASQLEPWIREFGRERLMVLQYERVRSDPQETLDAIWARLDLDRWPLADVEKQTVNTTDPSAWSVDRVEGLRGRLQELFQSEMKRVARIFDIDLELWPAAQDAVP